MHKQYLTEPECEIIEGADKIISAIGGFPSMENGELVDYSVMPNKDRPFLFDVLLVFDITGWKICAGYYIERNENIRFGEVDPDDTVPNRIALRFKGAREMFSHIYSSQMHEAIDIYFSNTTDRAQMYRASILQHPIIIPRPYCSFYLALRQLVIEFSEDECRISAEFV